MKKIPDRLLLLSILLLSLVAVGVVEGKDGDPAYPPTSPLLSQIVEGPDVTITTNSGQSARSRALNGATERVGLRSNEVVDIAVNYGTAKAGAAITAIPLDGGRVVGQSSKLIVGKDGILGFKFQAGKEVGVSQIALHDGQKELGLQFWVLDEHNPKRNPPTLLPGN